jgi:hypothetical protein
MHMLQGVPVASDGRLTMLIARAIINGGGFARTKPLGAAAAGAAGTRLKASIAAAR